MRGFTGAFTGPYGAFHLRALGATDPDGRRRLGDGPVLGVLRQLAAERYARPSASSTARVPDDLFALEEIAALGERLPDFRFVPVTDRFVHEALDDELAEPDVYMCGPPPMLEAVEEVMVGRGVDPARIFQDRFTASADASLGEIPQRRSPGNA